MTVILDGMRTDIAVPFDGGISVIEAAQNGMKESVKYLFVGQPCGNNATMGKEKVGGDGSVRGSWPAAATSCSWIRACAWPTAAALMW